MRVPLLLIILASCSPVDDGGAETEVPRRTGYLIVDADATEPGGIPLTGAIFHYEESTGRVELFSADRRFEDPQYALIGPDGFLYLVDLMATSPSSKGAGAIFRINLETGKVVDAFFPDEFRAPVSMAFDQTGRLFVADRSVSTEHGQGGVFHLDLESGECTLAYTDPRFLAPAFLLAEKDGNLTLLDADSRLGGKGEEGALFLLNTARSGDEPKVELAGVLSQTISPLGLLRLDEETLLIIDANADPNRIGGPLGAVFRFDETTGNTSLLVSEFEFRDPVRACVGHKGQILLVDANADPHNRGPDAAQRGQNITGPGAVFLLDPDTGAITLATSHENFVNPVSIVPLP